MIKYFCIIWSSYGSFLRMHNKIIYLISYIWANYAFYAINLIILKMQKSLQNSVKILLLCSIKKCIKCDKIVIIIHKK